VKNSDLKKKKQALFLKLQKLLKEGIPGCLQSDFERTERGNCGVNLRTRPEGGGGPFLTAKRTCRRKDLCTLVSAIRSRRTAKRRKRGSSKSRSVQKKVHISFH